VPQDVVNYTQGHTGAHDRRETKNNVKSYLLAEGLVFRGWMDLCAAKTRAEAAGNNGGLMVIKTNARQR